MKKIWQKKNVSKNNFCQKKVFAKNDLPKKNVQKIYLKKINFFLCKSEVTMIQKQINGF